MRKVKVFILFIIAVTFSEPALSQIQSGKIKGMVMDQNKEAIPFATIIVKEKGGELIAGANSDFDGKYMICPIPPGVYDIQFSYAGTTKVVEDVSVKANKTLFLDQEIYEYYDPPYPGPGWKTHFDDIRDDPPGGTLSRKQLTHLGRR